MGTYPAVQMVDILEQGILSTTYIQTHSTKILFSGLQSLDSVEDGDKHKGRSLNYDKEKYREMILDA